MEAALQELRQIDKCNEWIYRFQTLFDIQLPLHDTILPSKRTRTVEDHVLHRLQYFFFQQRPELDNMIEQIASTYHTFRDGGKRIDWLAKTLDAEFKKIRPHSTFSTPQKSARGRLLIKERTTPSSPLRFTGKQIRAALPSLSNARDNKLKQMSIGVHVPDTDKASAATSVASNTSTALYTSFEPYETSDEGIQTPDTEMDVEDPVSPSKPLSSSSLPLAGSKIVQTTYKGNLMLSPNIASIHPLIQPIEVASKRDENYRVREIPFDTFSNLCELPFCFRFEGLLLRLECYRAIQAGCPKADLSRRLRYSKRLETLHKVLSEHNTKLERSPNVDLQNLSLHAKLRWAKGKGAQLPATAGKAPVFKFEIQAARCDRLNSLQRKFGGHRFLHIDIPDPSDPPSFMNLKGEEKHIKNRILDLFRQELSLLGRKWKFLLVKKNKIKRSLASEDDGKGGYRAIFFACGGTDIEVDFSIMDVIDWALPLRENRDQTACKASARLDLVVSDTFKGYTFDPTEIDYNVGDIEARDVSDMTMYDDESFNLSQFDPQFDSIEREVTNDGCNGISPWVMNQMRAMLGWNHLPSVVQARVFGAKGLWYLTSGDVPSEKPKKLITISQSQRKVWQKEANFNHGFDSDCLTMNVVKHSHPVGPSVLYIDYIPILADRGISKDTIYAFAERMAILEVKDFMDSLLDSSRLRYWIQKCKLSTSSGVPSTQCSKVFAKGSQIIPRMIESGFKPTECRFLADEVLSLGKQVFTLNKKNFRIRIPQSTMVFGISDPFGYLKPHEIHLRFSEPITDDSTGHSFSGVEFKDALIARNPALRNSDIQKVRAVYKPELAHLVDVVVFPSAAKRSLAGKLQGGDYDGDTFWVCWQPELVRDFKNAPAPWKLPKPETYHITVDRKTLGETLQDDCGSLDKDAFTDWQIKSAENKMRNDLLGQVTLMHGKVVYHDNDIDSPRARALADLHDHLVDAEKQGYKFGQLEWSQFKKDYNISDNYKTPAYRRFLEDNPPKASDKTCFDFSDTKIDNIIDYVLFNVVEVVLNKGLKDSESTLMRSSMTDTSLAKFYDDTLARVRSLKAHSDLISLQSKVKCLINTWRGSMKELRACRTTYHDTVMKCRLKFDNILPDHPADERVDEWMQQTGSEPTTWELLKASAAMKYCYSVSGGKMVFSVLGHELCILKARMAGPTREILSNAYYNMKVRMPRKIVEESSDQESEVASDQETDYGDDDWCNYV